MEHESTTGETTRWQRADPGVLFADTISDIVGVLGRLSTAIERRDPDSVEGAVRLSVCMWLTAHTAHRQLIQRSEGDMADRSGSLLEARGSLLELSVRATTAIAAPRLARLLGELQQAFSAADINPMGRAACRPDRRTTTRCEPPFSVVQVEADFSPQSYVATFMRATGLTTQPVGAREPSVGPSCAHEPTSDAVPWTMTAAGAEMAATNPERDIDPHADTRRTRNNARSHGEPRARALGRRLGYPAAAAAATHCLFLEPRKAVAVPSCRRRDRRGRTRPAEGVVAGDGSLVALPSDDTGESEIGERP